MGEVNIKDFIIFILIIFIIILLLKNAFYSNKIKNLESLIDSLRDDLYYKKYATSEDKENWR